MSLPTRPKIYHILHVDRLASVLDDGVLWSDALVRERRVGGTTIGMGNIKRRRLEQNSLASHPGLRVGDCVPFYFCPRSIMLHLIWRANHPELTYRGGQEPIIHLEADLEAAVAWAAVAARKWSGPGIDPALKEGKQAEFLVEQRFPWRLVERIGVCRQSVYQQVAGLLDGRSHRPGLEILPDWYY